MRSRSAVRALTGSSAPAPVASRHGAACSASAAMPATCGTAADVPKNVFGNDPAPLIDTPSMAETSGFWRPSIVGPRLLKNSIVECVMSLHESLPVAPNAAAAVADAEQIAPTETADTGDPPVSPCAMTLYAGVLKFNRS